MTKYFRLWIILAATACLACGGVGIGTAHAAPVRSWTAGDAESAARIATRARVSSLLARDEVRRELRRRGISPAEAEAVVARLDDRQLERLIAGVEDPEAGGLSSTWAIALAILVITALFVALIHLGESTSAGGA